MRSDFRAAEHHSPCCNDRAFANFGIIHHYGTHADKGIVANLRTVYHHVMSDGYVIADLDGRFLIEGVSRLRERLTFL